MLFRFLGHVVSRAWVFVLAGWLLVLVAMWLVAPPWKEVAQDKEFAFLPANSPSRQAEQMYAKAFPNDPLASNIVLVLHRTEAAHHPLDQELQFINDSVEPGVRAIAMAAGGLAFEVEPSDEPLFSSASEPSPVPAQRSIIAHIETPNAPGTGSFLVSPDRRLLLVVVELTTEILSDRNWPTIAKIEDLVSELSKTGKVPPGVELSLTGSAVIGRDHSWAQLRSVRATGILTVVLVIALLVIIYRSPLLALIPLGTVYLAVQIALYTLAFLAGRGLLTVFEGLQIYVTILAYGAGVDYCLFLISRYKEELDVAHSPAAAVAGAVGNVGMGLAASAATVMCGIGMMGFAEFGKFREAGFAIPLSIFLVLCATLTFSPALLRLAGRWAFWPQGHGDRTEHTPSGGALWRFIQGRELQWIWEHVGRILVRRPGFVWSLTVALMAPFAIVAGVLYNHLSYDVIGDLPSDASSTAGTKLLQEHFPAGMLGPATLLITDDQVDFGKPAGRALVGRLTDTLRDRKEQLGLADVRSLTAPLGITDAALADFTGLQVSQKARQQAIERAAGDYYTADFGGRDKVGTRLDFILTRSPFSGQSVEDLGRIENAVQAVLASELASPFQIGVVGATASVRDLAAVMRRDRTRIELLVLASVLVILILLLRRVVLSIYLLLSVLFSYYTTLGVAFLVFWLLDPHGFTGIDWKVAIFLFTILIAVGEDYNILLMTRVDEESRRHGPVDGITHALTRTGPIISSCGLIMAGTFASLLVGSLTEMKQLGFALPVGVLLDTFVVRPVLVPAFLILQRTGRLPWSRRNKAPASVAAEFPVLR